jgi:hypothetical protein
MSATLHSKMPVPMGVRADGTTRPPLTGTEFGTSKTDPKAALEKAKHGVLGVSYKVDPMDLTQAGWGVAFASDADEAIREQLRPLLELRKSQVGDETLYQEFRVSSSATI